ncbi:hypothetical protein MLJ00_016610 [Escherichia coli]|nr:hypothetical protein [Escherichia coli]MCV2059450.1 hypothetical protein [Escherichia coli]
MAVIYTLTKSSLVKSGGQLHWNIDFPSEQQPLKIVNGRVVLRGWLLAEVEKDLRVAVKSEHLTYSSPFNIKRPDVISTILKQQPEKHQKLQCGFDISVPFSTKIIIGLESDGVITWLEELFFFQSDDKIKCLYQIVSE